jgi:hypothetical protein
MSPKYLEMCDVTTYVTPTMSSLIARFNAFDGGEGRAPLKNLMSGLELIPSAPVLHFSHFFSAGTRDGLT